MVSQSNPFHALPPSCSVKWRSARTVSSIFLGIDIHARSFNRCGKDPLHIGEIRNCGSDQRLFHRILPWKIRPFAFLSAFYAQRTVD